MNTATLAAITTITAEIALALHPILIKQVGVGLPTQLVARLGIYSVLGTAFSGPKDRQASWGSWSAASKSIVFGLMNLVHIGTSYLSYNHLPAGSALALFYLYPFFNILAGVLFLGDSFDTALILPLIIAFIGVLLISKYTEPGEGAHDKDPKNVPLGIFASIISALTETMIFLVAKTGEEPTAWLPILKLYPAAFGGLIAAIVATGAEWKTSVQNWVPLVLFNVFIGFLGYSLRFWSIPRLPTAIFSLLTFVGIAAAYMWGLMYAEEKPSLGALGGAGCIAAALAILKQKN